jgi:transcriptional regulator with XRE-family HTH domain
MGKNYHSISEMVQATAGDKDFTESFANRLRRRQIVKDLAIQRALKGLSQKDIADKLACSQGRISKLESSDDVDLRLGDMASYARALDLRLRIILESPRMTPVERVKQYAFRIREELDRLAGLAKKDHSIVQGVSDFFGEAFFNLLRILQDSAGRLPCNPEDGSPYITFEVSQEIVRHEEAPDKNEENLLASSSVETALAHA